MRVGSLFSGYGGLCELSVAPYLGGRVVWHSEIDPAASKVLAHHWPDTPNLGDITQIDWGAAEPVDVLTGGFPCQDVSAAGKRAGLRPDTRSGLWSQFAYAISELHPSLVVIENVRGLLSAEAHSDLEPCPLCLGDGSGGPVLRALGAVLGDLANLGYDAFWCGVRASDVGAPHNRFRVFIAAYPTLDGRPRSGSARAGRPGPSDDDRAIADARRVLGAGRPAASGQTEGRRALGHVAGRGDQSSSDASSDGRREGRAKPTRNGRGPDAAIGGTSAHADSHRDGLEGVGRQLAGARDADGCGGSHRAWGQYEPAIRRWERILGRPAPAPTVAGRRGQPVLNPELGEWMMGLPAGHITAVPGLTRNEKHRLVGNGVCPQQSDAALDFLIPMIREAVAA